MKLLRINALDTLFFRDGKPFTMGDDNVGISVFPPAPSVFRGFLRSLYFANGGDTSGAGETGDPTNNISIDFLSLKKCDTDEFLFPVPSDLIIDKNDKDNNMSYLSYDKNKLPASSYDLPFILKTQDDALNVKLKETSGSIYFSLNQLNNYIEGKDPGQGFELKEMISEEVKTGIGRDDDTRTTSDTGMLYQIVMQRPQTEKCQGLDFVVGYSGCELPLNQLSGLARIGGEGKLVQIAEEAPPVIRTPEVNGLVKMYLATPAIFTEGWKPEKLFADYCIGVAACSLGRYRSFGGWDVAKRKPKPMLRAVPAGSVYYLKSPDKSKLQSFVNSYHGKKLEHNVSIPLNAAVDGFGLVYFANIQSQK
jgi:CRISPR-associated protein Cmr3